MDCTPLSRLRAPQSMTLSGQPVDTPTVADLRVTEVCGEAHVVSGMDRHLPRYLPFFLIWWIYALDIKDPDTDRLVRELARLTGETITQTTRRAVEERLQRERARAGAGDVSHELQDIIRRGRIRPILDDRPLDELLGYDATRLPDEAGPRHVGDRRGRLWGGRRRAVAGHRDSRGGWASIAMSVLGGGRWPICSAPTRSLLSAARATVPGGWLRICAGRSRARPGARVAGCFYA